MTAILVPLLRADGGVRAPRGSRRWARLVALGVAASGVVLVIDALAHGLDPVRTPLWAFAAACAGIGLLVREARLRVQATGVFWGWGGIGFAQPAHRVEKVTLFDDACIVGNARTVFAWTLSRSDWDPFEALRQAFRDAGFPVEERTGRAPVWTRLQAYGKVLDGLLLVALAGAWFIVVV